MTWALLLTLAAVVFFTSESGKRLIGFGRDSWREVKKVVWPTRKEATQLTGLVFLFVLVLALFHAAHRRQPFRKAGNGQRFNDFLFFHVIYA